MTSREDLVFVTILLKSELQRVFVFVHTFYKFLKFYCCLIWLYSVPLRERYSINVCRVKIRVSWRSIIHLLTMVLIISGNNFSWKLVIDFDKNSVTWLSKNSGTRTKPWLIHTQFWVPVVTATNNVWMFQKRYSVLTWLVLIGNCDSTYHPLYEQVYKHSRLVSRFAVEGLCQEH